MSGAKRVAKKASAGASKRHVRHGERCHAERLVHGDLALGNVIVSGDGDGNVRLIDFGLLNTSNLLRLTTTDALNKAREAEALAQRTEAEALARRMEAEARAQDVRMLAHANQALALVELLVPKRIADEELGDAVEHILRLVERGSPPWHVYLKVASTIFWVILNATAPRVGMPSRPARRRARQRWST